MVNRIHKTGEDGYWKVSASGEAKKDKKRDQDSNQEDGRRRQQKSHFGETSDFVNLLTKDSKTFKQANIDTNRIRGFTFSSISTQHDKAILEVDISLTDGSMIKGAHLAVSRQEGMKYISRKPGEAIGAEQLVQGSILTVALPQKTSSETTTKAEPVQATLTAREMASSLNWYYYVGFGAILLAILFLIFIFLTV